MSLKGECKQCGKSLPALRQLKTHGIYQDGWDHTAIHYKCWREQHFQSDLVKITEGMAKQTLNHTTSSCPAASVSTIYGPASSLSLLALRLQLSLLPLLFWRLQL